MKKLWNSIKTDFKKKVVPALMFFAMLAGVYLYLAFAGFASAPGLAYAEF